MTPRPPVPIPTPKHISNRVKTVCATVLPRVRPVLIPCRPESYAKAGECHASIAEKVKRDGGTVQHGWTIWEIPPWEIQVEFHAVWRSPDHSLFDVTPALHGGSRVLFLPDPQRTYDGRNIAGVHYPYSDTAICREYAELTTAQERILYPPGEHHVPGQDIDHELLRPITQGMMRLFMLARSSL